VILKINAQVHFLTKIPLNNVLHQLVSKTLKISISDFSPFVKKTVKQVGKSVFIACLVVFFIKYLTFFDRNIFQVLFQEKSMAKIIENSSGRRTIRLSVEDIFMVIAQYQQISASGILDCENARKLLSKNFVYLPEEL